MNINVAPNTFHILSILGWSIEGFLLDLDPICSPAACSKGEARRLDIVYGRCFRLCWTERKELHETAETHLLSKTFWAVRMGLIWIRLRPR